MYEILTKNFPNLKKETYIQLQEEQRVSNKMNPNRQTPRYNISKTAKIKNYGVGLEDKVIEIIWKVEQKD